MAAERIAGEQGDVREKNQGAHTDTEGVVEPESFPNVVGEEDQEDERDVEKIAMDVLDDEREGTFAEIFFARLADGARRRVRPEGFVVCAAIVVTSEAESAGRPEDEHGSGDEGGQPAGEFSEPGVGAGEAKNFGRIEGRKIGSEAEMIALEGGPGGVNDECCEAEEGEEGLEPPEVAARSLAEASALEGNIYGRHDRRVRLSDLGRLRQLARFRSVSGFWFLVIRYSFLVSRFSLGGVVVVWGWWGWLDLGFGSFLNILIGAFAEALEFEEGF